MPAELAGPIVTALLIYVGVGLVFAVAFVVRGVDRIDPVARESGWGFRVVIFPGATALWPLLMLRWIRRTEPPEERTAHRAASRARR